MTREKYCLSQHLEILSTRGACKLRRRVMRVWELSPAIWATGALYGHNRNPNAQQLYDCALTQRDCQRRTFRACKVPQGSYVTAHDDCTARSPSCLRVEARRSTLDAAPRRLSLRPEAARAPICDKWVADSTSGTYEPAVGAEPRS